MLNQFKNYSQSKKNPVLSQRPSVFCSPDGDEDEEEVEDSNFLEMKGNSRRGLLMTAATASGGARSPRGRHFGMHMQLVMILIACLKSPPQRTQTPGSFWTRWLRLWQKEVPS